MHYRKATLYIAYNRKTKEKFIHTLNCCYQFVEAVGNGDWYITDLKGGVIDHIKF